MTSPSQRTASYGQWGSATLIDRIGIWLSIRKMRSVFGDVRDKRFADFGCGYHATGARPILPEVGHATLIDLSLEPDLLTMPNVTGIEGRLPEAMEHVPSGSLDLVVCSAILEHLDDPERMLQEVHRVLAPGGTCFITVPSWRGKWFLEFSAFKLHTSTASEMDDHKTYYDPKDLWPMLVRAGFRPRDITCRRYKLGLNTFARIRLATDT